MKKYPAYKKGIYDWWEQVPSTWQEVSMKEVAVLSDERCGERQEELLSVYRELGVIRKNSRNDNHNVESEDLSNYKMVYPGYLVMNKMKMWQGSLGISDYQGIVSPAYIVCKLSGNFDSKYLHTLLRATPFKTYYNRVSRGIRVGQWDMSFSDFSSLKIFLPNLQEQQQIVRYLDWKTSQINHLIHGYERLISLLEERKTAVINEAVTKGIRKGVAMKDSCVDWIGQMPAHWNLERVRQFFHIKKDIAGTEGYDVLSITQSGIKKKDITSNEGQMANDYSNYQFVNPGEFAMNHMDLLTGYIGLSPYFGVTSPDYRVFAINDAEMCDSEYYLKVFQIGYRRHIFFKFGHGAASKGRWRLPAKEFLNYVIPVPPIQEQKEIAAHIADEIGKLDTIIERITKETELLRERRTRLISDVVTGAFDVRGIDVPEYTSEQDMEVTEDGDEYEGERAGETDC